nr:ScbR family autoregulator-binding transcription factor [Rhodococcus sp. 14C212]
MLAGAAAVFEAAGFHRASLHDIVDAAGATRGALYHHFRSKRAVATAVVDEHHHRFLALADRIAASDACALDQLVPLTYALADGLRDDPILRAGLRLTTEFATAELPARPYRDWSTIVRTLLDRALTDGDVHPGTDIDTLGRFLVSAFAGTHLVATALTAGADLHQRLDDMWTLLLPSLATDPHRFDPLDMFR